MLVVCDALPHMCKFGMLHNLHIVTTGPLKGESKTVFHLEKWMRGGKNNTYRKFWGAKGLCMAVLPVRGSGGMPLQEIFEF